MSNCKSLEELKEFQRKLQSKDGAKTGSIANDSMAKNGYLPKRYFNETQRGHKPIDYIKPEDLKEQGVDVSMSFFMWYLGNIATHANVSRAGVKKGLAIVFME
jgi:hypothetical protein